MKQTIKTKLSDQVIADKENTKKKWNPYTEDEGKELFSEWWAVIFM